MSKESRKDLLKGVRRLVIKIGSNIIASTGQGLNEFKIEQLAKEVSQLKAKGYEVVIVSSGAIACGMEKLGLSERPKNIPAKQAAAAVGQSRLMWAYEKSLGHFNEKVAQVLLTQEDMTDRRRFLNSRNTLNALIRLGVIPIINENDTVAVEEIKFGDNDNLAALVTNVVDADLLVILSDVDGLYTDDPKRNPKATFLPFVDEITSKIEGLARDSKTAEGTGGMASKLRAAKKASAYGVPTAILNGKKDGLLQRLLNGEEIGTFFLPEKKRLSSRKHWIAFYARPIGAIMVDEGAKRAILERGKSLLPSGIIDIDGTFDTGEAVRCIGTDSREFARGLVNYGSAEIIKIKGKKSSEIEKILGYKYYDEVIHRDNLVVV